MDHFKELQLYNEVIYKMKKANNPECGYENEQPVHYFSFNIPQKDISLPKRIKKRIGRTIRSVSLTEEEARDIERRVLNDMKAAFLNNNLGIRNENWKVYGSFATGLCCQDSDIDFHNGTFGNLSNDEAKDLIKKVSKLFENNADFDGVACIDTARIPLVKLKHKGTERECSISFSSEIAVQTSKLMKLYVDLCPNLKRLILFMRQILVRYELHGTNKIVTAVLFWLAVFFLQQKKLVPTIEEVRVRGRACFPTYISGWDCSVPGSFSGGYHRNEPTADLFYSFLKFYKSFNFLKYVISPYLGYAIPMEDFEKWNVPMEALEGKFQRLKGDGIHSFERSCMNIQDPSILSFNSSFNVSEDATNRFRISCEYLYNKICNAAREKACLFEIVSKPEFESTKLLPINLNQTVCVELNYDSLKMSTDVNLKADVPIAIRKLMEVILEFKCNQIVTESITKITPDRGDPQKIKIPMIYMEYETNYRTLSNSVMTSIYEETPVKSNFKVFFMCEVEDETVKVFIDGDARFIQFMQNCEDLFDE